MTSASQILSLTRAKAGALVEREERNTGSRMAAYERVAQMIGTSPSWLQKFLSGERSFPTVAFNIIAQYERLCSRVELEAEVERERLAALREQFDAVAPGITEMVAAPSREKAAGTQAETETVK